MELKPLYEPETPPFRWPSALTWAGTGLTVTAASMLYAGMPAGDRTDLLVLLSAVALMFLMGGIFSGYRDSKHQSRRNVVTLGAGGVIGVGVAVAIDVVGGRGG